MLLECGVLRIGMRQDSFVACAFWQMHFHSNLVADHPFEKNCSLSEGTSHWCFGGDGTQARAMKWYGQGATGNTVQWSPSTGWKYRSLVPPEASTPGQPGSPGACAKSLGLGIAEEAGSHSSSSSLGLFLWQLQATSVWSPAESIALLHLAPQCEEWVNQLSWVASADPSEPTVVVHSVLLHGHRS